MDSLYPRAIKRPGLLLPPMEISRGWDPLSLLHPKYAPRPSLDRSQSSRSSGWVHGRRARGEPHPGQPTDGVRILSSFTVRRLLFFSDVQAERVEEGGSSVAGRRGRRTRRKAIVPCRMASPSVPWR